MLGFQEEHWMKVYTERRKQGLPSFEDTVEKYPTHDLVGKNVFMKDTEKCYKVENVHVSWWYGYHLCVLLVDENGSHGIRVLDSGNCILEHVIKKCDDFYENCLVIVEPEMKFSVYNPYISVNF